MVTGRSADGHHNQPADPHHGRRHSEAEREPAPHRPGFPAMTEKHGEMALADRERLLSLYSLLAPAGEEQLLLVSLSGKPESKARPRFANGRVYSKGENAAAEARTGYLLRQAAAGTWFEGNVGLACIFYRHNRQRIDVDNLLKHVCDAATGVLWQDDSQVTAAIGIAECDPHNPRTAIMVCRHASSLGRGVDALVDCLRCGASFKPVGWAASEKKYCSQRCAKVALTGVDLSEQVPCAACSTPFRRRTSTQKFCSRECSYSVRKGAVRPSGVEPRRCGCGAVLANQRAEQCRSCWQAAPKKDGKVIA